MQLTFLILLVLIPSITTLRCYVCNSNENPDCKSNPAGLTQECKDNSEDVVCRHIVQTVNKETSVVRSCGLKMGTKPCYKTAGINSANVCSCTTHLCNTATSFNRQQQMMTILSSFIVLAISMIVLR